jgi:multidrug efflux pump subunit AcrB
MDILINFFVKQKKLALVFTLVTIMLGLVSLSHIQREQFPSVDFEVLGINTLYPGASPEDVEQNVTNLIEDELRGVIGIETFTSLSKEGLSSIVVNLSSDVDNVEEVKQNVKNALNRVQDLPAEVSGLPVVIDRKTSLRSIIKINLGGMLPYEKLRHVTDELARTLALVPGVATVAKEEYPEQEIQVRLNIDKLNQYQLSVLQIIEAIKKRNKRWTLGNSTQNKQEKSIVLLAKFSHAKSVGEVVVKSSFDGVVVRLKDIASIVQTQKKQNSIIRVNGQVGFVLKVRKHSNADVIDTIDLIKNKVADIQKKYTHKLDIFYSSDQSKRVRNRLSIVTNNGLIGLFLVLVVLGIFLSLRTAFWVAVSLPVALLGSVALLGLSGQTINMVSLAAIILVLGTVVDDSIVVAESIYYHKQQGGNPFDNAAKGFKQVIMPVITTILTSIITISSMFLMQGTMGKFIYVLPLVVIFALLLSFLEVSIALPAHLAASVEKIKPRGWFTKVERVFSQFLTRALRFRYAVLGLFLVVLVGSLWFAKNNMQFVLFPVAGSDSMRAKLEMPVGTPLKITEQFTQQAEQQIMKVLGNDLDSLSATVGGDFDYQTKFLIELKPASERQYGSKELLEKLQKIKLQKIKKLSFSLRRAGPPQGEDIEINLVGNNIQTQRKATDALIAILNNLQGVEDINRNDKPGKERVEVVLDFEKMARFGVDFTVVSQYLKSAFSGIEVTHIRQGEKNVDFRIYLGEEQTSEALLEGLKVYNRQGQLVSIKAFSRLRPIQGEPNFNHFNGVRSVLVSANIDDEKTNVAKVLSTAFKRLDLENNYPDINAISEGGGKDSKQSMQSFKVAFLMSIVGVYLLLMLLFDSFTQPILIIFSIPFSLIGVIWAFFLHSEALSFFALMGILSLIGVIVNDSLVMVSHLNRLQKKDKKIAKIEWIVKGSTDRLRAVVLTSLTTLAGVIPLAYGIGGVDYILQPMVLALGYGLLFGTLMTLILLPCLYFIHLEGQALWVNIKKIILRQQSIKD